MYPKHFHSGVVCAVSALMSNTSQAALLLEGGLCPWEVRFGKDLDCEMLLAPHYPFGN